MYLNRCLIKQHDDEVSVQVTLNSFNLPTINLLSVTSWQVPICVHQEKGKALLIDFINTALLYHHCFIISSLTDYVSRSGGRRFSYKLITRSHRANQLYHSRPSATRKTSMFLFLAAASYVIFRTSERSKR